MAKKERTPQQKGRMSRTKGHSFEREVAQALRPIYPEARRQLEYQQGLGVDIANTESFRFQCKRGKTYAPITKLLEADDGKGIPILVTKADHKDTLVALRFVDFMALLAASKKGTTDDQQEKTGSEACVDQGAAAEGSSRQAG